MEEFYPEEFKVDIDFEPNLENDEYLKQYDIIHYHRTIGPYENVRNVLERTKRLGIITIMDLDDYWAPGPHHPAYHIIKTYKIDEKILDNLKSAEHITTTTDIFAKEISKYNKNVHILPNAIDGRVKQFISNPEPSERIRIAWLGGSSHIEDLKLLTGLVGKLKAESLLDKAQFVLCGYDLRGTMTFIDPNTGKQQQRPIRPHESIWYQYERIFTDDYKTVSNEYRNHLLQFTEGEYEDIQNEPYRRVWTKPINSYASNYNLFDVSLAPLVDNTFNKVKSQLKVIEAGFHKKALIAQDFGPYQLDLKHAMTKGSKNEEAQFDPTGNAFLIDKNKNHKDWYKYVKKLIKNPELIGVMGENLYNTVKDTYSVQYVCEKRRELYLNLLETKKSVNFVEETEKTI